MVVRVRCWREIALKTAVGARHDAQHAERKWTPVGQQVPLGECAEDHQDRSDHQVAPLVVVHPTAPTLGDSASCRRDFEGRRGNEKGAKRLVSLVRALWVRNRSLQLAPSAPLG